MGVGLGVGVGVSGMGAPDKKASYLASTRCKSSFKDKPCRSSSSSLHKITTWVSIVTIWYQTNIDAQSITPMKSSE